MDDCLLDALGVAHLGLGGVVALDAVEQVSDELEAIGTNIFHVLNDSVLLLPAALAQSQKYLRYQLVMLPKVMNLLLQLI